MAIKTATAAINGTTVNLTKNSNSDVWTGNFNARV